MPNENDRSAAPTGRKREALAWFPIHIARLMTTRGYLRIVGDDAALAALMRFMAHSWIHGSVDPQELESVCGAGSEALSRHMLVQDDSGNWTLPYLEDCRTEQDLKRVERAEAGRKGGLAKLSSAKHSYSSAKQNEANPSEERRVEERREERSDSAPTERLPSPTGEAAPAKKKPEKEPRKGEHVQIVEMFQRAWAEVRCRDVLVAHGFKVTRETDPRTLPLEARYLPVEADWAAAARLWKQVPDVAVIRRRMRNFFDSDAPYLKAGGLSLFCSKFSILVEPVMALNGTTQREG